MAIIGLRLPVVAQITSEPANAEIVYGNGFVVAHAISCEKTWTYSDSNNFYGDDSVIETDGTLIKGELTFGVSNIDLPTTGTSILGYEKVSGASGAPDVYEITDAPAPYCGFGYIRVEKVDNVTKYIGVWERKCQFNVAKESAKTKGESIDWSAPELTGQLMAATTDATGKLRFEKIAVFTTFAAAKAWLFGLANITD